MISNFVHVFNRSNTMHGDAADVLVHAKLAEYARVVAGIAQILLLTNPRTRALIFPLNGISKGKTARTWMHIDRCYLFAFNFARAIIDGEFNVGCLILFVFLKII